MVLPPEAEEAFFEAVRAYEEEQRMPYTTSFERIGLERGRRQGLEQGLEQGLLLGIEQLLLVKFGDAGHDAFEEMKQVRDVAALRAVIRGLGAATSLDEVRALYRPPTD